MGDKTHGGEVKKFGEKKQKTIGAKNKNKIRKDKITYVDKSTTVCGRGETRVSQVKTSKGKRKEIRVSRLQSRLKR